MFRVRSKLKKLRFLPICQRCQIRDAGANSQNLLIISTEKLHVFRNFRTWANQAHISEEHVEQLGEFIEFCFPENASKTRHSAISGDGDLAALKRRIRYHSTKLVDHKSAQTLADPFLTEEDWPSRIELYQHSDKKEKGP